MTDEQKQEGVCYRCAGTYSITALIESPHNGQMYCANCFVDVVENLKHKRALRDTERKRQEQSMVDEQKHKVICYHCGEKCLPEQLVESPVDKQTYCPNCSTESTRIHPRPPHVNTTPQTMADRMITNELIRMKEELETKSETLEQSVEDTSPSEDGATKHDHNKLPIHLIPPEAIVGEAMVLGFGAQKYGAYNWAKGMSWSRMYGAAMRHLWKAWSRIETDPESGIDELLHVRCCIGFLIAFKARGVGVDDRPQGCRTASMWDVYERLTDLWNEDDDEEKEEEKE
jgi:hypothetical protein